MTDRTAPKASGTSVLYTTLEVQRKNFGQLLLEARLQKELTIAEAAEHAHCKKDTVQALESGNLDRLHLKPYYAKSTIEALCLLYDIAPDAIVDAYDMDAADYAKTHGGTPILLTEPAGSEEDEGASQAAQHRIAQILIAVVLVAVALLILCGWIYKGYQARHLNETKTYDLPALLPMSPPAMEPLEIP